MFLPSYMAGKESVPGAVRRACQALESRTSPMSVKDEGKALWLKDRLGEMERPQ